jgi:uncharacterized protein
MGRLLFLAILVIAGIWLVKRALARAERGAQGSGAAPRANGEPQDLVGCARCGMLVPRAEARAAGGAAFSAAGGAPFCSDEHARLGPRMP